MPIETGQNSTNGRFECEWGCHYVSNQWIEVFRHEMDEHEL